MRPMNDQAIARLEAKLEQLIEGAFAQLFSKTLRAQDIALHLSRAMEGGIQHTNDGDPRPYAPDYYTIRLNPDVYDHLMIRQPVLGQILSQHLVELATLAGYRLNDVPSIEFVAAQHIEPNEVIVDARHRRVVSPQPQSCSASRCLKRTPHRILN